MGWVKHFYHDAKSCVSNNCNMSKFFPIRRGVRQGCPLSTYLFIICNELLLHKISTTEDIKGISYTNMELKRLYSRMMHHLYWMANLSHFKH